MFAKFKRSSICTLTSILVTGCAAGVGAKNTQYEQGRRITNSAKTTVHLCRPPGIYLGSSGAGLYINTEPAIDLGSGERYTIDTPLKDELWLGFVMKSNQGGFGGSSSNSVTLTVKKITPDIYVLFTVQSETSAAGVVATALFGGAVKWSMRAKTVSKTQFEKECDVKDIRFLTHKAL